MQASDEFVARAAKLFGSLETQGAAAGGWSLNTQQGFAAGAEDQDSSADEGDGDGGPVSLPGAAGSDEDEDEYKVRPGILLKQSFSCHHALSPEGSPLLLLRHPPPSSCQGQHSIRRGPGAAAGVTGTKHDENRAQHSTAAWCGAVATVQGPPCIV